MSKQKKDEKNEVKTEQNNETTENEAVSEQKQEQELTPEEMLKAELAALNDKYLRLMAEYDNYRKRTQREKDAIYPEAVASTLGHVLPLMDNFDRAMSAPCSDVEFKKGLAMIQQSFSDMAGKLGLETFGKEGEEFDPNLHNAIAHIEDENAKANTITQIFQSGYKIGDRIIRHAIVQVAN